MQNSVVSVVLNNFTNDNRVLKECVTLKKAGYSVQIVALHERNLKVFDEMQKIPVHRVKLKTRDWSKNKFMQLIKYAEFVLKVIIRYKHANIFHCNDLNTLPLGIIIKKIFNKEAKVVYDAHEYETEINGLSGVWKKLSKRLECVLIKHADAVLTVSDAIANEYVRLYGIQKPALVLNTPLFAEITKKNLFREVFDIADEQTIFLYQGGLSSGRGIEILLDVFKTISEMGDKSAVAVFMGYGPLSDKVKETSEIYSNIHFHPAVDSEMLLDYTSSADYGLLFYENNCLNHYLCSPNKIYEYLMAEIPVIVADLFEIRRIVNDYNVGIVVDMNDKNSMINTITSSLRLDTADYRSNILKVKQIFNWEQQEKVLLDIYGALYEN